MTTNAVDLKLVDTVVSKNSYCETPRDLKAKIKMTLGEALASGKITREEMNEALEYLDDDMRKALTAKWNVDFNLDTKAYRSMPKRAIYAMIKSNLSFEDLKEITEPYTDDYTINTVKLNRKEKKEAKNGELSRSEKVNLENAINARIAENGGEPLNPREIKILMESLGFNYDVTEAPNTLDYILHFATFGLYTVATTKPKVKEEIAYPTLSQSQYKQNGSVVNKTEVKMQDLEAYNREQKEIYLEKESLKQIEEIEEQSI